MKKWTGKVMAGTVAAAVLFGGIGGLATAPKAFADDDITYTVVPDTSTSLYKRVDVGLNSIVAQASSVVGISVDDLKDELQKGKSIAEVANLYGLSQSDLLGKMKSPIFERIDNALNQKRITEEEAAQLKKEVTEKFSEAINQSGYQDTSGKYSKKLKLKTHVGEGSVAKVLGITKNELDAAFSSGKTIADIAKEKGISEEKVIAGLKDELNASLKAFIHKK